MRDTYHRDLDTLSNQLVEMGWSVRDAISHATHALLQVDLRAAESVIEGDAEIDRLREATDRAVHDLLARQQPVARDLRTIIAALRTSGDLERMGDYAVHVAKIARRRYPDPAIPSEVSPIVAQMSGTAERIVAKACGVLESRNVVTALELESDDDAVDRLHRELFHQLMSPTWQHGVEPAIDVTAVGRNLERYCDHAVHVAHGVVFLVTGDSELAAQEDGLPR